ncbi:hypothetical protein KFK09_002993 [Dendrobium nobile]|uniref:Retrovirus-related Pol polyprotein from transposon TNT 1-94-like beta-barrel domain-containing protein n=1 Tax=Dendrobium nobile TaxID=94219 RepID=A0A8T3C8T7_DENNO|nr:hypothetical protein KFK09_002993 [Dendrobium nobile]
MSGSPIDLGIPLKFVVISLFDSGASSHLTPHIDNLLQPTSYKGFEKIIIGNEGIGNGGSIPIAYTSRRLLPNPHRKLYLRHLLHVPNISHNVLSVSNLSANNYVLISFDASGYQIKDMTTNHFLHKGPSRNIYEGRIPKNRVALRLLAEEMINWPDLEVEVPKKKRTKSLYARATDTGVDPREAAKRLNIDWDSAADIEAEDEDEDIEVPPAVGYGALYLVTALPIIIGVSVILVLFYNSLQ